MGSSNLGVALSVRDCRRDDQAGATGGALNLRRDRRTSRRVALGFPCANDW